jgi:hypothetical protein
MPRRGKQKLCLWPGLDARLGAIGAVVAMIAGVVAPAVADATGAHARVGVTAKAPSTVAPGGTLVVVGSVTSRHAAVSMGLQQRFGRGSWRTLAHARATHGRYLLSARAPRRAQRLDVRAVAVRAGRVLGSSRVSSVAVRAGAPTTAAPGGGATVVAPSAVRSVPAPGSPGAVVLAGAEQVAVGSVLAISVGPSTPDGFLGKVGSVTHASGGTIVDTVPATLEEALPEGSFELDQATRVDSAETAAEQSGAGVGRLGSASAHAAASGTNGTFNQNLSKSISCAGGATFAAQGTVGLNATPDLSISWSLFHGISARFTETVSASASLSGSVSASASCTFARTGLLREPARLGTFVGDVLGVPVVVAFEGQIYLDGKAEVQGAASVGVAGQASASGGIAYSHGKASVIAPTTSLHFGAQGPSVTTGATLGAHVTPELQALLYGVGGPVFDAETGLDFSANPAASPWWTLTAPLVVTASLKAPVVHLSTPALTLYSHTFAIAHAPGGLAAPSPPPALPPPAPAPQVPATGPTLADDEATAIPMEGSVNYQEGDLTFDDWSQATGEPVEVAEALPSQLTGYRCVALIDNQSLSGAALAQLTGYLDAGGTIVAIGEHEGDPYVIGDDTLNQLASSLGVGLALDGNSVDYGDDTTFGIVPSTLTEGVFSLGDAWASSVDVFGSAEPLVEVAEGNADLVGEQTVGSGTFVMAGDSDMFTDDNFDVFDLDDNAQFVRDLCP